MILLLIISLVIVIMVMVLVKKLSFSTKVTISAVVLLLINSPTILFLVVGDKPPADARVVTQEEIEEAARNAGK